MPHSPHFGHRNFPQKIGFVTFMCLLNANFMQKKYDKSNEPILEHVFRDGRTELNKQDPLGEPGSNKKSSLLINVPNFNQEKTKVTNEHVKSKQSKNNNNKQNKKTIKKVNLKNTLPLKGSFPLTEVPVSFVPSS